MQYLNASGWSSTQLDNSVTRYYEGEVASIHDWSHCYQAFAVVDWDLSRHRLTAYRDHFGLAPFYYTVYNNCFIFGSNLPDIIKALPKHPEFNIPKLLDDCFPIRNFFPINYSNETYYQNIHRLEPGHSLVWENNKITSNAFWQLNPDTALIRYEDERDYTDHFTHLFHEAVRAQSAPQLAAEFSGGLDSSSIVVACHQLGLKPALFSHVAPEGSDEVDDYQYVQRLVDHLKLGAVHQVDASHFDPVHVFNAFALRFAGPAPFIFFMLANNVHSAVVRSGCTTLLSGFGGDECVSSHASYHAFYPQLIRNKGYVAALQEMRAQIMADGGVNMSQLQLLINVLRYTSPFLFHFINATGNIKRHLKDYLQLKQPATWRDGWYNKFYPSVQAMEYDLLQGSKSHHVRMRVEYSAVTARALGFSYGYPLLHPKLVEFCFALPPEQKRRHGIGRWMIRQYLAQYLPKDSYNKNQKRGSILPATMQRCKNDYQQGKFNESFKKLPFVTRLHKQADLQYQLITHINAYMLKYYCQQLGMTIAGAE